jgi:hypothetical protein
MAEISRKLPRWHTILHKCSDSRFHINAQMAEVIMIAQTAYLKKLTPQILPESPKWRSISSSDQISVVICLFVAEIKVAIRSCCSSRL